MHHIVDVSSCVGSDHPPSATTYSRFTCRFVLASKLLCSSELIFFQKVILAYPLILVAPISITAIPSLNFLIPLHTITKRSYQHIRSDRPNDPTSHRKLHHARPNPPARPQKTFILIPFLTTGPASSSASTTATAATRAVSWL